MSLATSCLKRKLTVSGKTVYLGVPTVRQVVEIMGVMRATEDEADVKLLFELLSELSWSAGESLHRLRKLYDVNPREFVDVIQNALMQGYDPKDNPDSGNNDIGLNEGWKRLLSEYCQTTGNDAFEVYNTTPFPFFMEMVSEMRRREAENHIHRATEAMFAMGGSKEIMKEWEDRAGLKDAQTNKATDIPDHIIKHNRQVLKRQSERRKN